MEDGPPTEQSDRQLLLGILCVQCGLVRPEQLVQAGGAWSANRSRSLADHLQSMGFLRREDRAQIEQVVDLTVGAHGGDARRSLESFGGERAVYESMGGALSVSDAGDLVSATMSVDAPFAYATSLGEKADESDGTLSVSLEHPGRYDLLVKDKLYGFERRQYTQDAATAQLGKGGMGRVLVAFDHHLGRDVAIKELLPDRAAPGTSKPSPRSPGSPMAKSGRMVARFLREARVTGQLEHPSIVPVYELGKRADDTLYYAMKLVRGRTLRKAVTECGSLADRLMLLSHVADLSHAVAYAHSRGVINRDIKPDNIMVGEFGETVVLDWGLAKVIGQEDIRGGEIARDIQLVDAAAEGRTVAEFLGTPNYMPPEQAWGKLAEVDERSDIWSIGAVLHEVLTGRPPFAGASALEVVVKVRSEEVKPVLDVEPAAPAELAAIAGRCMRRERDQRYQNARDVAHEIERFQSGGRVQAYEYRSWELLRRFVGRNRALSLAVAVAMIVLVVSSVVVWNLYRSAVVSEENAQRNERAAVESREETGHALELAQRKEAEARAAGSRALTSARRAEEETARAETARHRAEAEEAAARQAEQDAQASKEAAELSEREARENLAAALSEKSEAMAEHKAYAEAVALAAASFRNHPLPEASGRLLAYLSDPFIPRLKGSLSPGIDICTALEFTPDGTTLVSANMDGGIRLWDVAIGRVVPGRTGTSGQSPRAIAVSPDGRQLAVVGDQFDISVSKWEKTRKSTMSIMDWGRKEDVLSVSFSPDGGLLATGYENGAVQLWDADCVFRGVVLSGHSRRVLAVDFSPDGSRLLSTGDDGIVKVWDHEAQTVAATVDTHGGPIRGARFRGNDEIVCAGDDGVIGLWSASTGALLSASAQMDSRVLTLRISPDGSTVAAGAESGEVVLWDLVQGSRPRVLGNHDKPVLAVAFSPDGTTLASGSDDRTMKLWDLPRRAEKAVVQGHTSEVYANAFSPDGRIIATGGVDGKIRVWDPETETQVGVVSAHRGSVRSIAFSGDGKTLASGGPDGFGRIWDTRIWTMLRERYFEEPVRTLSFSPDGARVIVGGGEGLLAMWDVKQNALQWQKRPGQNVLAVDFSHDGRFVAEVGASQPPDAHRIRTLDSASGTALRTFAGDSDGGWLYSADVSPDGRWLAAGGERRNIHVWDLEGTGHHVIPDVHSMQIRSMRFSPDGRHLTSGGYDGAVVVLALPEWQPVARLTGHQGPVFSVAWSPDGRTIVSSGADRTTKLWAMDGLDGPGNVLRYADMVGSDGPGEGLMAAAVKPMVARYSPDGRSLALGPGHTIGSVSILDARTGLELSDWRVFDDEPAAALSFSADGARLAAISRPGLVRIRGPGGGLVAERRTGAEFEFPQICFGAGGKVLAMTVDTIIELWEFETGEVGRLEGHSKRVRCLAFSPTDDVLLASGGEDQKVRLWDISRGEELQVVSGYENTVRAVAFSSDGHYLLSAGFNRRILIMDTRSGVVVRRIEGANEEIWGLEAIPGSDLVASAGRFGRIDFWDVARLERAATFQAHGQLTWVMTASPDGARLRTAAVGEPLKSWGLSILHDPAGVRPQEIMAELNVSLDGIAVVPDPRLLAPRFTSANGNSEKR